MKKLEWFGRNGNIIEAFQVSPRKWLVKINFPSREYEKTGGIKSASFPPCSKKEAYATAQRWMVN